MKKNEREIALDILADVIYNGAYNNLAVGRGLAPAAEHAPAVTTMVNGVLRRLIYLDYVINEFSSVKTAKMKPVILCLLRLSVYQLLFMDGTPDYAVCSDAVNIAKRRGFGGLAGFVNGVLRNIVRQGRQGQAPVVLPCESDEVRFLSVKYSCPEWIVGRFLRQFGREKTERSLAVNQTPPDVTIRVNTVKTSVAALKAVLSAEGVTVYDGRFDENYLHISGASVAALQSFKDGLFFVQDESAALPVVMCCPQAGGVIVDLCAAPGGKSFAAAVMTNDKARILAFDIYEHKRKLIEGGARRLGLTSIETAVCDALKFNPALERTADIVLLDAPCSGLGLLRKKPDVMLSKTEENVTELARLQREMLDVAQRYVKPGGTLVYSTCTLTKEENEDNAEWFAKHSPLTLNAMRTIIPCDYETDGFFAAKFLAGNR